MGKSMTKPMSDNNKNVALVVYILQAASFLFGITFVIAVIINYVKMDDVRNTWLESHFKWQLRTFWYGLLWAVVGIILTAVVIGVFVLIANYIWIIYRVVKGWLALNDHHEIQTNTKG